MNEERNSLEPAWKKTVKEYGEALLVALVLAIFIRSFVVQAFKIPSGSMLQTLQIGDHLLVNRFAYGLKVPFMDKLMVSFDGPRFGDIVVFTFPDQERAEAPGAGLLGGLAGAHSGKDFIKRVIGLPGDTIEVRNKRIVRNGVELNESYVQWTDPHRQPGRDDFGPITVPQDKYFVMGDNRDESFDSRFWGFVPRENVHGKAWIIYWSWNGPGDIRLNRIGRMVE